MAKCPYCGAELIPTETTDSEYWGDAYHDTVEGYCPSCETEFGWEEVYTYHHFCDLKEITDDE